MAFRSPVALPVFVSDYAAYLAAKGVVGENFPEEATATSTGTAITGTVYAIAFGAVAGRVLTNLLFRCEAAGAGLTLGRVAVCTAAGARVAGSLSADVKGLFVPGPVIAPLGAPVTLPATGLYYGLVFFAGTTGPILLRGNNGTQAQGGFTPNPPPWAVMTGQTDIPASLTLVASAAANAYWLGLQ